MFFAGALVAIWSSVIVGIFFSAMEAFRSPTNVNDSLIYGTLAGVSLIFLAIITGIFWYGLIRKRD